MYWQLEYLREADTMTRNSTYRVDLPDSGLLGSLLFRVSAPGVSAAFAETLKWRVLDFITKVEVIANGSTVIKSLTGSQIEALQFFDQGLTHLDYWHSYATGTKWWHCLLNFGRFFGDTAFGLDLSKFSNVELRVSNDGTSTYFGSDFSITTLMYILRDAPPGQFAGYLRTEEWRKWTTVADETKYLELPVDYKIRRVVMQAIPDVDSSNVEETSMFNVADDVELSLKSGVLRVFKGGIDDLARLNALSYGRELLSSSYLYMTADYGRNVGIGYVTMAVPGAGTQDGAGADTIPTVEGRRTSFTQKPETYEADTLIALLSRGICPENCVVFRFDQPDEEAVYLDAYANRTVKLNVHTKNASSAADGTISVVLDRLVR